MIHWPSGHGRENGTSGSSGAAQVGGGGRAEVVAGSVLLCSVGKEGTPNPYSSASVSKGKVGRSEQLGEPSELRNASRLSGAGEVLGQLGAGAAATGEAVGVFMVLRSGL